MNEPQQARLGGAAFGQYRHVCGFFQNKEEEYRVLLPFIKEGFEQGHCSFHIVDGERHADHIRRLKEAGIDVANAEFSRQLEICHWEHVYLQDGHFDKNRQLSLIERLLADGKTTRIIGGVEWAMLDRPGVHDLIEYESKLNDVVEKHTASTVCCTYDLSRISAAVVMDALRVHPAVIIGGILQVNPFYVPPAQFLRELAERRENTGTMARA